MTFLYMDTNVGCDDNYNAWDASDEGRKSLIDLVKGLLH